MARELETDRTLAPLAAQFVLLKLDIDQGQEYGKWRQKYRATGNGLPLVYIVRADGTQIYGAGGAPQNLAGFLQAQLPKAGKIPSAREMATFQKTLADVEKMLEDGRVGDAVTRLSRQNIGGVYSAPTTKLMEIITKLEADGQKELEAVKKQLATPETEFEGLMALLKLDRDYGKMPTIQAPVIEVIKEYRGDVEKKKTLTQAEAVDVAQQQLERKNERAAKVGFARIVQQHPDTPAAEFAQTQLAKLGSEPTTPTEAPGTSTTKPAKTGNVSEADLKKAASYLRLGKLYRKSNPARAKSYLEKVGNTAPDTDLAQESAKLLKEL